MPEYLLELLAALLSLLYLFGICRFKRVSHSARATRGRCLAPVSRALSHFVIV
jgi:hypothetical protein